MDAAKSHRLGTVAEGIFPATRVSWQQPRMNVRRFGHIVSLGTLVTMTGWSCHATAGEPWQQTMEAAQRAAAKQGLSGDSQMGQRFGRFMKSFMDEMESTDPGVGHPPGNPEVPPGMPDNRPRTEARRAPEGISGPARIPQPLPPGPGYWEPTPWDSSPGLWGPGGWSAYDSPGRPYAGAEGYGWGGSAYRVPNQGWPAWSPSGSWGNYRDPLFDSPAGLGTGWVPQGWDW